MKTFLTTLAAILVSAVVISTGLYAKVRIDQWERAKQMCYALINAENSEAELTSKRNLEGMHMVAASADSQADVLRVAELGSANVTALQESQKRVEEMDRRLLVILKNKPFGIPLTAQERNDLDAIKTELSK